MFLSNEPPSPYSKSIWGEIRKCKKHHDIIDAIKIRCGIYSFHQSGASGQYSVPTFVPTGASTG